MNNALGLGIHPLMPTSVLLKVSSASHSPMRFSLPNVILCYFVLECSWCRNHHNFQSYVCVSDLTLSSSFLQILLPLPCQFSRFITYQTASCVGSAQHHTQSCDAAMSGSLNDPPCMCVQSCPSLLRPHGLQPTRFLCPWDFPGRILAWIAISFSGGSFLTQGSNPHLLLWQADSLPLSNLGSS